MCWVIKKFYYRTYQKVLKLGMNFMNWKEPELLEGEGAVLKLPSFIIDKGINKVLIVTDKGLMNLHILDPMFEELKKVGVEYVIYDGVQPNPTIPSIEECKDLYIQNKCEGIIASRGQLSGYPIGEGVAVNTHQLRRGGGHQILAIHNQCTGGAGVVDRIGQRHRFWVDERDGVLDDDRSIQSDYERTRRIQHGTRQREYYVFGLAAALTVLDRE